MRISYTSVNGHLHEEHVIGGHTHIYDGEAGSEALLWFRASLVLLALRERRRQLDRELVSGCLAEWDRAAVARLLAAVRKEESDGTH